ncbi:phospholipase D, Pi-PLD-like-2 [Phytophthora infestans T30-4]|uniref:phospholipase D n=1 Tax=Phytophthora infestans (strain T30-4) TaxID=403677 RepID=D0P385_PHYIT|nr:phospholipase D, Pi-PLD-like-2 [Phytophthora infestans T30-4]EEY59066.1 phospholipase D, Pi-PLD-like-2 [Phytophthora infestans T30-4]|eukprot:XP_002895241.1 phospholipase D, Pi-PLD-like-2 [Phytophthora infestans T30-4]
MSHVCEFKKKSLSCGLIERQGLDLSDGSNMKVDQPLLAPTDWLLTESEITASRGGSPRSDLSTFTTGNDVKTYTVTKEFFDAAFNDLSSTKTGDRVMLTGWGTDLIPFQPNVDGGKKSQLHDVVSGVIQRGGSFHALVWANLLEKSQNIKVRNDINAIPASPTGDKPLFVFDDRTRVVTSSHHQKNLIIASNTSTGIDEQPVAFVGGIDITSDRWDTISHNESVLREATGVSGAYKGWLDGHVRIHGPAAKDVAANFLARWNSDYKPTQSLAHDLLDFENPSYSDLAPLNYASSKTSSTLGRQSVQIVRTFSCQYKRYNEFAPRGENSLFQARIKALKNAKNFIYIEDQYFILVPELLNALLEVMPTIQRLIVVAQRPVGESKATGYEKYLFDMIAPIQKLYPNKLQIFSTKKELNLYIHSKVVIIDDVYLSVGSANWNRRSMTSDSELGANIIDDETVQSPDGTTVLKAARDFRIRKFQEMTGLSYEKLNAMTFIEAANQFDEAAVGKSSIIEPYQVKEQAYFTAVNEVVRKTVDPQDTCM